MAGPIDKLNRYLMSKAKKVIYNRAQAKALQRLKKVHREEFLIMVHEEQRRIASTLKEKYGGQ